MPNDQGTYKVFFSPETTAEEARTLFRAVEPDFTADRLHSFYPHQEIGCNVVTFGVVSCWSETLRTLQNAGKILRSEPMTDMRIRKSNAEDCGST